MLYKCDLNEATFFLLTDSVLLKFQNNIVLQHNIISSMILHLVVSGEHVKLQMMVFELIVDLQSALLYYFSNGILHPSLTLTVFPIRVKDCSLLNACTNLLMLKEIYVIHQKLKGIPLVSIDLTSKNCIKDVSCRVYPLKVSNSFFTYVSQRAFIRFYFEWKLFFIFHRRLECDDS